MSITGGPARAAPTSKKNRIPRRADADGNPVSILPFDFGNPAIRVGPVAFRPPIARSLALSAEKRKTLRRRSSSEESSPYLGFLFGSFNENFR